MILYNVNIKILIEMGIYMEELIEKSIEGDKESYIELMNMLKDDMYKVAIAKLRNIEDANDAIQNTIINSYEKILTLKDKKFFKTWLIKILINECNDIYRKQYRYLKIIEKLKTKLVKENREYDCYITDGNLNFEKMISILNDREKIIITLYYNSRFTINEIAEILNMNINTVKTKISRARKGSTLAYPPFWRTAWSVSSSCR